MPEVLETVGPAGLAWWQWIGLVLAVPPAYLAGRVASYLFRAIARRLTQRTITTIDDKLFSTLAGPLRLLGTIAAYRAAVLVLDLGPASAELTVKVLLALFAVGLVWGALRVIDVVASHFATAPWAIQRPASRALLSIMSRAAKVIVVVVAALSFLGSLGLPVGSLLAGLGIGGIALAFGAQKTVENLFGAIAIGVDQPLREGDFVRIDADVLGTVEAVGLRSTRIRSLDRTVVTLPNGRLADMKIETFAARDRCRLSTKLGLVYDTTADQLRQVLDGLERVLREQPKIWPDDVVVRFASFGESSLDIEVIAWFTTSDYGEFRSCRQATLLGFMEVVESAGTSFAFPTRTVHLVGGGGGT